MAWAEAHPEHQVLSAGKIIGAARERDDPEFLRALATEELTRSQQLLVAGFAQLKPTLSASIILLDGHVLIEQPCGSLYEIATQTFRDLGVAGLIHLENEIGVIQTRRACDTQRQRPARSDDALRTYQQASRQRAHQVAKELGAWIRVLASDDPRQLAQTLAGVTAVRSHP